MPAGITRRTFNAWMAQLCWGALVFAGTSALGVRTVQQVDREISAQRRAQMDWLFHPESPRRYAVHPNCPSPLIGTFANGHFAYDRPQKQRAAILSDLQAGGFQGIIINVNDALEADSLGKYDHSVLARVCEFVAEAHERNLTVQISCIDHYTMEVAWNPVYGTGVTNPSWIPCGRGATSVYVQQGYTDFFVNPSTIRYFQDRLALIVETLQQSQVLNAVSGFNIGNELSPPAGDTDFSIFNSWYDQIALFLKNCLDNVGSRASVLSGAAHPAFFRTYPKIQGLDGTTLHAYPGTVNPFALAPFVADGYPYFLIGNEAGVPSTLMGFDIARYDDPLLYRLIRELIFGTTRRTVDDIYIGLPQLALWKIDDCDDGFRRFLDVHFPQTFALIDQYRLVLNRVREHPSPVTLPPASSR